MSINCFFVRRLRLELHRQVVVVRAYQKSASRQAAAGESVQEAHQRQTELGRAARAGDTESRRAVRYDAGQRDTARTVGERQFLDSELERSRLIYLRREQLYLRRIFVQRQLNRFVSTIINICN